MDILTAEVNNMLFGQCDGIAKNISLGISVDMTRKEFKKFIKDNNGTFIEPCEVGVYRNIHTGKMERLWGLD